MKYLILVFCVCFSANIFGMELYESNNAVLQLNADSTYRYYPKEQSLKSLVVGNVVTKQDSLILTSHQYNGEAAVFAIYLKRDLSLKLLYLQKEQTAFAAKELYLTRLEDSKNQILEEYYWTDYYQMDYTKYIFTPEKYIVSVQQVKHGKMDGPQRYFYPTPQSALKEELSYKDGLKHGMSYYYEIVEDDNTKVALVKKEKYKKGLLQKSKKLATPPIFYTRHF